jgi:N-acyl-L-homoserine lactone synthetase
VTTKAITNEVKRKIIDIDDDIHRPFLPATIRPDEVVTAQIRIDGQTVTYSVFRLSPFGVEIVVLPDMPELSVGVRIGLSIRIGKDVSDYEALVVQSCFEFKGLKVIGLRLVGQSSEKWDGTDRRSTKRWLCSEQFLPTGVAPNPVKFNDFLYFRLLDVSSDGFRLETSLRNKFIIKGMLFECRMSFPTVGDVSISFRVKNVSISQRMGKDFLAIGASMEGASPATKSVIGQYLLQFSPEANVKSLSEFGFKVQSLSRTVEFDQVKTLDDFEQVLKLRHLAYSEAKKIGSDKLPKDMSDKFDVRSRIVVGRKNSEIVCSARMIFCEEGDSLEQEEYVEWPETLPRPDSVVEITRACTDPNYRGGDLLLGMFRFICRAAVQSKRRWLVICATDEMIPLYKKLGFSVTNVHYNHKALNNTKHTVLIADVVDSLCGKNVNPFVWNVVWRDLAEYMVAYGDVAPNAKQSARLKIYKALGVFIKRGAR